MPERKAADSMNKKNAELALSLLLDLLEDKAVKTPASFDQRFFHVCSSEKSCGQKSSRTKDQGTPTGEGACTAGCVRFVFIYDE